MGETSRNSFSFGEFVLDPNQKLLLRNGEILKLPAKTFELLAYLIKNPNRVINKNEIMEAVWQDSLVEDANLSVHISTLRKALGNSNGEKSSGQQIAIETFPKVGYRLNAIVARDFIEDLATRPPIENALGQGQVQDPTGNGLRNLKVLGLAVLALMAIGGAAWFVKESSRTDPFLGLRVEKLTTHGKALFPSVSPDGNFVVYGKEDKGSYSVWLKSVGSTDETQILGPIEGRFRRATFSPDGKTLFLAATTKSGEPVVSSLPVFGGNLTKIPLTRAFHVEISPDGSKLAYLWNNFPEGKTHLMIANIDGYDLRPIATRQAPNYHWTAIMPSWSPDGKLIACVAQSAEEATPRVVGIDVETGAERVLTPQIWRSMRGVKWLPDMSGFLLSAAEETSTVLQIWRISYPDGLATRVTNDANHYFGITLAADAKRLVTLQRSRTASIWVAPTVENRTRASKIEISAAVKLSSGNADGWDSFEGNTALSWTPDNRLVFSSEESGNGDIWIMNADGSGRRPLTTDKRLDTGAQVSPDGSKIVFQSNRTNQESLWMMDIEGGEQRQITSLLIERRPFFSFDGNWIYYLSWQTGKVTIWRLRLAGGEPQQMTFEPSGGLRPSPYGDHLLYRLGNEVVISHIETGVVLKKMLPPGEDVRWSPFPGYLSFIKTTNGIGNLWLQPIEGGSPIQLTERTSDEIITHDWSRDGSRVAFSTGSETTDVIVMSAKE